ncbi:MAG: hypothetical protein AAGJ46_05230 [Planctomycetota bacterium]
MTTIPPNTPSAARPPAITVRAKIRPRVTCPHCWAVFDSSDAKWVAVHADLQSDPKLGEDKGQRFLPSRFTVEGNAIDAGGVVCQDTACPVCHLRVPRPLFELPPMFASIAGTPSCGKTYFLASMTWRLRSVLPGQFGLAFSDADPVSNEKLNEYENQQFFNPDPDAIVKLAKTEEQGELYEMVDLGNGTVRLPKPFLFAMRPTSGGDGSSRLLCLYDNAGESFQPGKDDASAPVTRHLAHAKFLMFCFDPTQDPRLREDCKAHSLDPQVVVGLETRRQESVLHELIDRVRRHGALHQEEKVRQPLMVIVTKFDVWGGLIERTTLPDPWTTTVDGGGRAVDSAAIEEVSRTVRALLWKYTPEMVSAAEAASDRVLFVPVSATGAPPIYDEASGAVVGLRAGDVKPIWAETPLLYALANWSRGLLRSAGGANAEAGATAP